MREFQVNQERLRKSTQIIMIFVALGILATAFFMGRENLGQGDYYGFAMLLLGEASLTAFIVYIVYKSIIKRTRNMKIIIEDDHLIWIGIDGRSSVVNFEDVIKIDKVSRGIFIETKSKGRLSIPDKLDDFNIMVSLLQEKITK